MTDTVWWRGEVECAVCEHKHVAIVPLIHGEDYPLMSLECPKCGHLACAPVDDEHDEFN